MPKSKFYEKEILLDFQHEGEEYLKIGFSSIIQILHIGIYKKNKSDKILVQISSREPRKSARS